MYCTFPYSTGSTVFIELHAGNVAGRALQAHQLFSPYIGYIDRLPLICHVGAVPSGMQLVNTISRVQRI
jgi:hypothetical protein